MHNQMPKLSDAYSEGEGFGEGVSSNGNDQ